jgi:hypothetical protein
MSVTKLTHTCNYYTGLHMLRYIFDLILCLYEGFTLRALQEKGLKERAQ